MSAQYRLPAASSHTQKWTRVVILTLGILIVAASVVTRPLFSYFTKRDRAAAPVQQGVATIEQILPPHFEENAKPIPAQVWVRFKGELLPAENAFGVDRLRVGAPAEIVYRVGRSGRIYVDRVEPLREQPSSSVPFFQKQEKGR